MLIADPRIEALAALQGALARDDLEIVTARSVHEALELAQALDLALALVDVQLPEPDGYALATQLRDAVRSQDVPIVFLANPGPQTARLCLASGAVDCLLRPIDELLLRCKVDLFIALDQQRRQLREAERARETFVAVLGHDLRSPLNGILLSAQRLLQLTPLGDAREAARRIERHGARMQRMIDDVLDAARFRLDGRVSLSPVAGDLRVLVASALSELQGADGRVRLRTRGDTTGSWDEDRVLQVLSNLLGNALAHSPDGSSIEVDLDGEDPEQVRVRVRNDGPVIPRELHERVFEPFRQAPSSEQSEPGSGLGLGLYIAQQLALAHGGGIGLDSSAELGTRFELSLPRHVSVPTDVLAPARLPESVSSQAPKSARPPPRDATVLLVEDDPNSLIALDEVLRSRGYRPLAAVGPSEALAEAARHLGPIDLLITDLRLPEMNGAALASKLRAAWPAMQVIFMSGMPSVPDAEVPFIRKPIDVGALLDLVERTLAATDGA